MVEPLSAENIDSLIKLVLQCWGDSNYDEELDNYQRLMSSDSNCVYLVKVGQQYIAFMHLSIRADYVEGADELPVAYIEAIYVEPHFQQKGIGGQLVKMAESWAKSKGLKQLASDTHASNYAGVDFHKRTGFSQIETIVCFIKDVHL